MIKISEVSKKYGSFLALDNINMNIKKGSIFGFIGPNGAGKTTTIRILSTLISDFEGKIEIDGMDIYENYSDIRHIIGYMPDFVGVYKSMTVYEYLNFFAQAYNEPVNKRKKIIDDCLELTDLTGKSNVLAIGLSRGMTQRLILAKTLIHNPKILLLDEPASGLDPRARIEFKEIIKVLSSMDKTIIISSHILSELSDICDSVGIIEQGKIVAHGSIDIIKKLVNKHSLFQIKKINDFTEEEILFLEQYEHIVSVNKKSNDFLEIEFSGDKLSAANLLQELCYRKIPIISFNETETDLEDVFMKITKGIVS